MDGIRVGTAFVSSSRFAVQGSTPPNVCERVETDRECQYKRQHRRRGRLARTHLPPNATTGQSPIEESVDSAEQDSSTLQIPFSADTTRDGTNIRQHGGTQVHENPPAQSSYESSFSLENAMSPMNPTNLHYGFLESASNWILDFGELDRVAGISTQIDDNDIGLASPRGQRLTHTQVDPWTPFATDSPPSGLRNLNEARETSLDARSGHAQHDVAFNEAGIGVTGNAIHESRVPRPVQQQQRLHSSSRPEIMRQRRESSVWSDDTNSSMSLHHQARLLGLNSNVRHSVLAPLLPYTRKMMPDSLTCDLLEAYFDVESLHGAPLIPFVPWRVLLPNGFIGQQQQQQQNQQYRDHTHRPTSKALLASMLWLAAQTAEIPLLSNSIARRKDIRRKLLHLTTSLLKPLSEVAFSGYESLADYAIGGSFSLQYLDECIAYAHLAMVTSASAFTRASLRWWNLAFSLARELGLNRTTDHAMSNTDSRRSVTRSSHSSTAVTGSEHRDGHSERLEERRRLWWFLYTIDRHISLMFNKPLALLDSECLNLQKPFPETLAIDGKNPASIGPTYVCTGVGFFEFFTPLAALLGEIVHFTLSCQHPRFGTSASTVEDWSNWQRAIHERLDEYERSLHILDSAAQDGSGSLLGQHYPRSRAQVVRSYGQFFVHVFHFTVLGEWDPITILNKSDEWLRSPQVQAALEHIVLSTEAMKSIFIIDPGLQFMPFFLGLYLFQASLPLVVIADHLKQDAGEKLIQACEILVRAHEKCISQVSTEALTTMLTVLRTALMEMQGLLHDTTGNYAAQRRQLLAKFDWSTTGRGLAP